MTRQLVPDEACLSEIALLRYLQDDCTPSEARAIDRHVAICPFCTDALEGLMTLEPFEIEQTLHNLDSVLSNVESNLDEKKTATIVPIKKINYRSWAIAASVAMLLSAVSVWYFSNKKNEVVPTVANTSRLVLPQDSSQNIAIAPPKNTSNDDPKINTTVEKKEIPSSNPTPVVIAKNPPVAIKMEEKTIEKTNPVPSATPAESAKTAEPPVAEAKPSSIFTNKDRQNTDNTADNSLKTNRPSTQNMPTGPSPASNAQTVPQAVKKAKAKESQSKTQLEQAKNLYEQKKYADANAFCQTIISEQTSGKIYEDALWYLANGQAKLGKTAEAKTLFSRIVKENGVWAKEAKKILE